MDDLDLFSHFAPPSDATTSSSSSSESANSPPDAVAPVATPSSVPLRVIPPPPPSVVRAAVAASPSSTSFPATAPTSVAVPLPPSSSSAPAPAPPSSSVALTGRKRPRTRTGAAAPPLLVGGDIPTSTDTPSTKLRRLGSSSVSTLHLICHPSGVTQDANSPDSAVAPTPATTDADDDGDVSMSSESDVDVVIDADTLYVPTLEYCSFPFELDVFQKRSCWCVEHNCSVLVSAHTSAGKTVVAEYAIGRVLKEDEGMVGPDRGKGRVIYTSPIKALSNQKYRDLCERFGTTPVEVGDGGEGGGEGGGGSSASSSSSSSTASVGLITGDVTIAPMSRVLVMTTEILRTMLYKGHEILSTVSWVVFDEVHYLRDSERGVVWEECIVLLPSAVRFVFLSATIPNAAEFASWIARLKQQVVHVVYTDRRPIPLQHYLFPVGGRGMFLAKDENGVFRRENFERFSKALGDVERGGPAGRGRGRGRGRGGRGSRGRGSWAQRKAKRGENVRLLLKMVVERNFHPCIFFAFSRAECEEYAMGLKRITLNEREEQELVTEIFHNAIDALNDEDRRLPQIQNMLPLLRRGIGIHHSGLLPLMKEIIEILFQEGLVKCLFATETFAMGLNMPARTCIFTSLEKFDGVSMRFLSSGEYIQMSGRAGRRGTDKRGIVIGMVESSGDTKTVRNMLTGEADQLKSAFYLSFFTVLNLLRVDGIDPMYIVERSFFKFQSEKKIPKMAAELGQLTSQLESISIDIPRISQVEAMYNVKKELDAFTEELRRIITRPIHLLGFLVVGRLVKIGSNWGWGIVLSHHKSHRVVGATDYIVDVLIPVDTSNGPPRPIFPSDYDVNPSTNLQLLREADQMAVIPFRSTLIQAVSTVRIFVSPNLRKRASQLKAKKSLVSSFEHRKGHGFRLPLLDPVRDMEIPNIEPLIEKIRLREQKFAQFPSDLQAEFDAYKERLRLTTEIKRLNHEISVVGQGGVLHTLQGMKKVLRFLNFVDGDGLLTKKGKIAAEISSGDCLVLTELILSSNFMNLPEEVIGAILSCFVYDSSKQFNLSTLPGALQDHYKNLQQIVLKISSAKAGQRLYSSAEEQSLEVRKFCPALMEATRSWLAGRSFLQVAKLTDVFEGEIIRVMRRLEELLRQLVLAVKIIGERTLEKKFQRVSSLLKRDIVFSASLYL